MLALLCPHTKKKEPWPCTKWFSELVASESLAAILYAKNIERRAQHEQEGAMIVLLHPGQPYTGPLTPWSLEARYLWHRCGNPYDACSVVVKQVASLDPPLLLPGRLRNRHQMWSSSHTLTATDVRAKCAGRVMNLAEVFTRWGISRDSADTFCAQPFCWMEPHLLVELISRGRWSTLLLRASSISRWRVSADTVAQFANLGYPPQAWLEQLQRTGRMHESVPQNQLRMPLSASGASEAADLLRRWSSRMLSETTSVEDAQEMEMRLQLLVMQLDTFHDELQDTTPFRRIKDASKVIQALFLAMHLRNRSDLQAVVQKSLKAVFPEINVAEITACAAKMPSAATLQRSQFLCDVAYCCWKRDVFRRLVDDGGYERHNSVGPNRVLDLAKLQQQKQWGSQCLCRLFRRPKTFTKGNFAASSLQLHDLGPWGFQRRGPLSGALYIYADASPQAGEDYLLSTVRHVSAANLKACKKITHERLRRCH